MVVGVDPKKTRCKNCGSEWMGPAQMIFELNGQEIYRCCLGCLTKFLASVLPVIDEEQIEAD